MIEREKACWEVMEAHLIMTSLDKIEWHGCCEQIEYSLQSFRVCGAKIYSHVAIMFTNVPPELATRNLPPSITRPTVYGSKQIIFESLQAPKPKGKLGFSTLLDPDSWYVQWKRPTIYFYRIDPSKVDPRVLFDMCEEFARIGLRYSWNWAQQATYCPCLPCGACSLNCSSTLQPTTNCVGTVAICIAAAVQQTLVLRKGAEGNEPHQGFAVLTNRYLVRKLLGLSRFHPELYYPSEMLRELQEEDLISEKPVQELTLFQGRSSIERRMQVLAPLPYLTMMR